MQRVYQNNRFELKYRVDHRAADRLKSDLAPYCRFDEHRERDDGYPVYSVYWDSPALTFFHEKIEGIKNRRKLRVRRYAGVDYGFVEIKRRVDRTLQKGRARVPLEPLFRTFRHAADPTSELVGSDPVIDEALSLRDYYDLRPTMAVSYRRLALFGIQQPDLRITFDRRLQYHHADLDIARPFEQGRYMLDPRHEIVEFKFDDAAPRWLSQLTRAHRLQLIRYSKYCTAVDLAFFGGNLT